MPNVLRNTLLALMAVIALSLEAHGKMQKLIVTPGPAKPQFSIEDASTAIDVGYYGEALKRLLPLAERGDADAQYIVGWLFAYGKDERDKFEEEASWLHKLTEPVLDLIYPDGKTVSRDYEQAAKWWRKAAEQGHAEAQYQLGNMNYDREIGEQQDDAKAVVWWRKAAEQGNVDAQNALGWMYEYGRGVQRDNSEAAQWYLKAAEQGLAIAQSNIADMYLVGQGVRRDFTKASEWYQKAAEQSIAHAQHQIGVAYEDGQGVLQDYVKAYMWYDLAIAHKHGPSRYYRDAIAQRMNSAQIAEAQRLAREWKPKK